MIVEVICKLINASYGWTPGTSEALSFSEICDYYNILINKYIFELDANHDFNKYMSDLYPFYYKVIESDMRSKNARRNKTR